MSDKCIYFEVCDDFNKYTRFNIKNIFRYNTMKKIEDDKKITYIIYKYKEHQDRMINKIDRKIGRIVGKNKKTRIILSKEIKEICKDKKEYKHIYSLIKYYEGNKQIFNDCIEEILENVIKIQNETKEEQSIYILAKSNQVKNENRIINMLFNYKAINIVTPNIKDFKKLEDFLDEHLETISIINNKRKSLSRAKYIINIDFSKDELLEYNINRTATIFNLNYERLDIKNFDGVIINNININNLQEKFDIQDLYLTKEISIEDISNYIKEGDYKLIGNNGYVF